MSMNNIMKNKYEEAVEWLDDRYAYFLTHVLNIGKPEAAWDIPTAAVALPEPGGNVRNFKFIFNPDFMDKNSTETNAFVMAHETMHIVLNHLGLARNFVDVATAKVLDKKQKGGTPLTDAERQQMKDISRDMRKSNVAADCVINDYLVQNGLDPDGLDGCFGEAVVGYNCANSTVTEVFDSITDQADQDGEGGDGRGSGAMDGHDWLFTDSEELAEALDDLYEQIKDSMPVDMDDMRDDIDAKSRIDGGQMAGRGQDANQQIWAEAHGVKFDWGSLLKEIEPDIFKDKGFAPPQLQSWHRRPRKLASFPDTILPVKRVEDRMKKMTNEVPSIVLAIDTSGSVTDAQKKKFLALAKSIPQERIKLFACYFNTHYGVLDIEKPSYRSGGTDFSAIEDYIAQKVTPELGHYPKAVVVITDGCADFYRAKPTKDNGDRYFWLIDNPYGGHYNAHKNYGRDRVLNDYVL